MDKVLKKFITKYNNDEDYEGITLIQYKKTKPISEKGNYEWLEYGNKIF